MGYLSTLNRSLAEISRMNQEDIAFREDRRRQEMQEILTIAKFNPESASQLWNEKFSHLGQIKSFGDSEKYQIYNTSNGLYGVNKTTGEVRTLVEARPPRRFVATDPTKDLRDAVTGELIVKGIEKPHVTPKRPVDWNRLALESKRIETELEKQLIESRRRRHELTQRAAAKPEGMIGEGVNARKITSGDISAADAEVRDVEERLKIQREETRKHRERAVYEETLGYGEQESRIEESENPFEALNQ